VYFWRARAVNVDGLLDVWWSGVVVDNCVKLLWVLWSNCVLFVVGEAVGSRPWSHYSRRNSQVPWRLVNTADTSRTCAHCSQIAATFNCLLTLFYDCLLARFVHVLVDQEGTDPISLLILFFFFLFLLGWPSSKSPRLRRFRWDQIKFCRIVLQVTMHGLLESDFWCESNFQEGAMTSFHTEKCCHLVSANAASAPRIRSSVRQFLIHSTFVLD